MADIQTVGHQLAELLSQYSADYIEAHLEEGQTSHIIYRGRELESIGKTTSVGGNVRALVRGGWGFASFNSFSDLPGRVELAVKQAQFAGNRKSELAPVEPVVDTALTEGNNNPVTMPLAEKKQLLDEYNDIIWQTPKIQTSTIGYGDSHKKAILANSLGSYI